MQALGNLEWPRLQLPQPPSSLSFGQAAPGALLLKLLPLYFQEMLLHSMHLVPMFGSALLELCEFGTSQAPGQQPASHPNKIINTKLPLITAVWIQPSSLIPSGFANPNRTSSVSIWLHRHTIKNPSFEPLGDTARGTQRSKCIGLWRLTACTICRTLLSLVVVRCF
jgi:hypothetical protein